MAAPGCPSPPSLHRRGHGGVAVLFALAAMVLGLGCDIEVARAQQQLTFPPRPPLRPPQPADQKAKGDPQMLVRADEVDYDYTNDRVSAVGNVQIYYSGSTLQSDRVIYDQTDCRGHAAQGHDVEAHAERIKEHDCGRECGRDDQHSDSGNAPAA